jgi:hypothetical protein
MNMSPKKPYRVQLEPVASGKGFQLVLPEELEGILDHLSTSLSSLDEISSKQAHLEEAIQEIKQSQDNAATVARLQEQNQAPKTIGDYSAEDQAYYFMEFIKKLSPEEKAQLAEECGLTETGRIESEAPDNKPTDRIIKFMVRSKSPEGK